MRVLVVTESKNMLSPWRVINEIRRTVRVRDTEK